MSKIRARTIWFLGVIIAAGGSLAVFGQAGAMGGRPEKGKRPDLVIIDTSALAPGKDDMPPVQFVHGRHNQAVNQDCAVCHLEKDGTRVFMFKRRKTLEGTSAGDFYHENCIPCHVDKRAAGQKTGPRVGECRLCHKTRNLGESDRQPVWFDSSLHYLHEESVAIRPVSDDGRSNCRVCHHLYNRETGRLYYEEGAEDACQYCHKAQKTEFVRSLRQASHDSCVGCHQRHKEQKAESGPVSCAACHGSSPFRDKEVPE